MLRTYALISGKGRPSINLDCDRSLFTQSAMSCGIIGLGTGNARLKGFSASGIGAGMQRRWEHGRLVLRKPQVGDSCWEAPAPSKWLTISYHGELGEYRVLL